MIANFAGIDIRPGSMGRPLPGIEAAIVRRREDGGLDQLAAPDAQGELALRAGWPSMFRAYLGEEERYRRCFRDGWYLTGDLARRDADGFFWFAGRADDVIKTAGHLIGPTEVESTLLEHPAVVEAGVIGKPDPVAGEVVKAFVSLRTGFVPDDALRRELLGFARARLGPAVAPREIEFRDALPHTRSGKIMRRLLRARELGLPTGDLSTLEGSARMTRGGSGARPRAAARDAPHPPLRGEVRRALHAGEDPRLPAPVRGRGGGGRRRVRGARGRGRGGRHLSRARPRARARRLARLHPRRDVRQARGLLPRPRRLDASLRRPSSLLRRQRDRGRRAPDRGRPRAGRSHAAAPARHRLLLRRRRGGRGRVPRGA